MEYTSNPNENKAIFNILDLKRISKCKSILIIKDIQDTSKQAFAWWVRQYNSCLIA